MSDMPPSALLLAAIQACLSALFLLGSSGVGAAAEVRQEAAAAAAAPRASSEVALQVYQRAKRRHASLSSIDALSSIDDWPLADWPASSTTTVSSTGSEASQPSSNPLGGTIGDRVRSVGALISRGLNWRSSSLAVAGGELGLWMCLAFGLEVFGLELISATETAFLDQSSILILTPLLVCLGGQVVKRNEWLACLMGLGGSLLVAADGMLCSGAEGAASTACNPMGVAYILASALFFAVSTVRLGRYSNSFSALDLTVASTVSLAVLSVAWESASLIGHPDEVARTVDVLRSLFTNPSSAAMLAWIGVGPGALASFLQTQGQKTVPPAQAQVILSMTPVFASMIAMGVLDASDEAMGTVAWGGAALMLAASLVAGGGDSSSSSAH